MKGDEAAFRTFDAAYRGRLWRYLFVVTAGNEEACQEALQGTFIRLARYVRVFHREDVFWSWLTRLARSSHYDRSRQAGRYRAFLGRLFEKSRIEAPRADAQGEERLAESLDRQLRNLGPEEKDLIERKYSRRMSVGEIAAELGVGEKAIESRLSRIRRKLKDAIVRDLKDESST